MQTKQDVLQACSVTDNVVKLPDVILERKLYQDVSKALEGIGGKWNKKAGGFTFPAGTFKQSGTMVRSCILIIDKQ